jgi:hypothetical protein
MKTFKNPILVTLPICNFAGLDRPCDWYGYFNMENQEEIWKDVVGYEGLYQVSNLGRVWRYERQVRRGYCLATMKARLKVQQIATTGYWTVNLTDNNGKFMVHRVHRLVAIAFIPNPKNKPCVNHIDSNRLNPYASNLEWATKSEDCIHAYRVGGRVSSGKGKLGEFSFARKIVEQRDLKGELINTFDCIRYATENTGILGTSISNCTHGRSEMAGGFIWKLTTKNN